MDMNVLLICSRWKSKGELFINAYLHLIASLFYPRQVHGRSSHPFASFGPSGDHSRPLKRATWERAKHSTPKIVTTVPKIVSQLYSSVDPSIIAYVAGRSVCRVGELTPPSTHHIARTHGPPGTTPKGKFFPTPSRLDDPGPSSAVMAVVRRYSQLQSVYPSRPQALPIWTWVQKQFGWGPHP